MHPAINVHRRVATANHQHRHGAFAAAIAPFDE
jgi:hypothetical protein